MKTLCLVLAFIGFNSFSALAQNVNHTTIITYTLNTSVATGTLVPAGAQTAIVATYVVVLKDSVDVSKIYVRISSNQQSNGDLLNTSYLLSSAPVIGANGLTLLAHHGSAVLIRTVMADPQAGINYEICTEDSAGQKSSYLSRIK